LWGFGVLGAIQRPALQPPIDFGWFYWLTKPMFIALEWIYAAVGNFGIAIILFTIAVDILPARQQILPLDADQVASAG